VTPGVDECTVATLINGGKKILYISSCSLTIKARNSIFLEWNCGGELSRGLVSTPTPLTSPPLKSLRRRKWKEVAEWVSRASGCPHHRQPAITSIPSFTLFHTLQPFPGFSFGARVRHQTFLFYSLTWICPHNKMYLIKRGTPNLSRVNVWSVSYWFIFGFLFSCLSLFAWV
jgi:hypothetical protein